MDGMRCEWNGEKMLLYPSDHIFSVICLRGYYIDNVYFFLTSQNRFKLHR